MPHSSSQGRPLEAKPTIAIIGAGASGIIAMAKTLQESGVEATLFETSSQVGGVWNYRPSSQKRENELCNAFLGKEQTDAWMVDGNVPNAIYDSLHTNLPHPLMAYRDFPYPASLLRTEAGGEVLFPSHDKISQYLALAAKHYNVQARLSTSVLGAEKPAGSSTWTLTIYDQGTKSIATQAFDHVWVANGHYTKRHIPEIAGMAAFPFPIVHSQQYKSPTQAGVVGKRILVIGSSWSGRDLVRETSKHASYVYWSCRAPDQVSPPGTAVAKKIKIVPVVQEFRSDGSVVLADGSVIQVSCVLLATGYLYDFPFLKNQAQYLEQGGKSVRGLSFLQFWRDDPTLCFLGLPRNVISGE
ncbi:hypothetical protein HDU91_000648 [Kappamyces sp. JEL0680]|nr:hypothetical protein HDU91_000648 [Kappamyces sp. JEL0680]